MNPSRPCPATIFKIDLPLGGHRVGAPHAIARAFEQELANADDLRQPLGHRFGAARTRHAAHALRGGEVRQAAALCEDSAIRKRNLNTLDAEIDAFNNLITVQCIGS
jgi:hypothetical protein